MLDETNLRDTLLAFNLDAKSQYVMLSAIFAELVALRETVRSLDPTFADVMEATRQDYQEKNAATVQALIDNYDAKSQLLKDGHVC